MEIVIPFLWTALLLFMIAKSSFFSLNGINKKWNYAAFIYKVILGVANYYIWLNIIGHGDSMRYFHDSLIVYNSLFEHPAHYFELLTGTSIQHVPEQLIPYQKELYIEWHVKEYNMVRLLAILNVFTFGNVWANIIIIGFIGYSASVVLLKAVMRFFTINQQQKQWLFAFIFFLPSLIFWSGGLLKEAPTFILLSIIFTQLFKIEFSPDKRKTPGLPLFSIVLCLWLLLLIRDYVAIIICANLVLWFFSRSFVKAERAVAAFFIGTVFTALLLFALPLIMPQYNYLSYARQEQNYFLIGTPDADYTFSTLGSTPFAVAKQIPYALNNIFFRPNIINSNDIFRVYQSLELILLWGLILFLVIKNLRNKTSYSLSAIMVIAVCIELLIIYGLLVTDADTLSRYRSIPLFFMLFFLIAPKIKEVDQ